MFLHEGRIRCALVFLLLHAFVYIASPVFGETRPDQPVRKNLVAAIPIDSPPTYYKDTRTGEASGFAVDVMNDIGKLSGYSISYVFRKDWAEIIEAVETGAADIAPSMGITEERKKKLAFTLPTDTFPVVFFSRADSAITEPSKNMVVGVIKGSAAHEKLKEKYDTLKPKTYDGFQAGLMDLLAGHIDVFCCPAPTLVELARRADLEDKIRMIGRPLMELKRATALRPDNPELLSELNGAIDSFVNTPAYQRIYAKWYGKPKPYWTNRRIIAAGGALLFAVMSGMAAWRFFSVRKLNRKLQDNVCELRKALDEIRTLQGILPICSYCKKIRDDNGAWTQMEAYISKNAHIDFSHGCCPECAEKAAREYADFKQSIQDGPNT